MSNLSLSTLIDRATGDAVEAKYLVHGSAKAWANLNGTGTISLNNSLNNSSVVDNGVGDYTFNHAAAMVNAFSAAGHTAELSSAGTSVLCDTVITASNMRITVAAITASTNARIDRLCTISAHGDLA
jgi:hypothetical protein